MAKLIANWKVRLVLSLEAEVGTVGAGIGEEFDILNDAAPSFGKVDQFSI